MQKVVRKEDEAPSNLASLTGEQAEKKRWRIISDGTKGGTHIYYEETEIGYVERVEITMDVGEEDNLARAKLFITLPKVDVKVPDTTVELFKRAYPVEKLEEK